MDSNAKTWTAVDSDIATWAAVDDVGVDWTWVLTVEFSCGCNVLGL